MATSPVVVVTGWRDPDRVRWLATLSTAYRDPVRPDRPVVVVQAPPGHTTTGEALRGLLFALGKSPHVTGGSKHDDGQSTVPAAWLLARQTREIVVNDAAQLPGTVLRSLIELAGGVQARLWLIGHHNRAGALDDIAEDVDADEWTLEQFDETWSRPDQLPDPDRLEPPVLRTSDLPPTSALTFRADCRRVLPADRFEEIDRIYLTEHHEAAVIFDHKGHELGHDTIAEHLRRRVRQAKTTDQIVTTVRATEAAALLRGFYVDVDLPVLLNAAERNPRPGRYELADVVALDAYSRPMYPAACSLAMCEVPPDEMIELTVGDVAADGSSVTCGEMVVDIPEALQPYLHTQLLVRRFDGADDDEPLLLTESGKPIKRAWVARSIKLAEVECSVRLARPRYDRKRLTVYDWLTAHGLAVRSIHGTARRRQRS